MINLQNFTNMPWYDWNTLELQVVEARKCSSIVLNNFKVLEDKLDVATRQLDYYDIYKFTDSVDSHTAYIQKYAMLPNNRALAVVKDFDDKYHIGDIILKNDKGQEILIPSRQNGIFVPQWYKDNGNSITIRMGIVTTLADLLTNPWDAPESGSDWVNITYDTNYKANINFQDYQSYVTYNIQTDYGAKNITFNLYNNQENNKIIYPVIKFYTATGEEIYCDDCILINAIGNPPIPTSITVNCPTDVMAVIR